MTQSRKILAGKVIIYSWCLKGQFQFFFHKKLCATIRILDINPLDSKKWFANMTFSHINGPKGTRLSQLMTFANEGCSKDISHLFQLLHQGGEWKGYRYSIRLLIMNNKEGICKSICFGWNENDPIFFAQSHEGNGKEETFISSMKLLKFILVFWWGKGRNIPSAINGSALRSNIFLLDLWLCSTDVNTDAVSTTLFDLYRF